MPTLAHVLPAKLGVQLPTSLPRAHVQVTLTLYKARDARSCGQEVVQLDQALAIRARRFKGVPINGDSVMEWTYWHERQTTKASRTQATDIALTRLPETLHVESQ